MLDESENSCLNMIWKIENFLNLFDRKDVLMSPLFTLNSLNSTHFALGISESKEGDSVDIFLSRWANQDREAITINCKIEVVVNGKSYRPTCIALSYPRIIFCSSLRNLIKLADLTHENNEHVPEDTVTVICSLWNESTELQQRENCHADTRLQNERGTFIWGIEDFNALTPNNRKNIVIKSSRANFRQASYLRLYLDGNTEDEKFNLEAIQQDTRCRNTLSFKMTVRGPGRKSTDFAKGECVFQMEDGIQKKTFQSFISKQDIMSRKDLYMPKGSLILHCDVTVGVRSDSIRYEPPGYAPVNPRELVLAPDIDCKGQVSINIVDDFRILCNEGFLSDVTLRAEGKDFPAHKNILGARSPVFRTMFTIEMSEKTNNSVDISDFGAETVQHMLQYIYSDTVEDLNCEMMSELYRIANKYELRFLREKCSVLLRNKLNTSNACDLLVLSDLHLDDDLKIFVLEFILDHDEDVMQTESWRQIEKDNPRLVSETMKYLYRKVKGH